MTAVHTCILFYLYRPELTYTYVRDVFKSFSDGVTNTFRNDMTGIKLILVRSFALQIPLPQNICFITSKLTCNNWTAKTFTQYLVFSNLCKTLPKHYFDIRSNLTFPDNLFFICAVSISPLQGKTNNHSMGFSIASMKRNPISANLS